MCPGPQAAAKPEAAGPRALAAVFVAEGEGEGHFPTGPAG
ncbi:predicted protein [Streptomyces iranensis]|uniref:Uncharacterized protein n=1 Tax=Streptomyces iranensis TaxID=576784 RepID=A0A061ACP2_9ACTN|nr:predicted protein [Streptomyces iranensis]